MSLNQSLLSECKERLLQAKNEVMNRLTAIRVELATKETGGDEGDQSVAVLQEARAFNDNQRWRQQLFEIEAALSRLQAGDYGYCEETSEPIEVPRLLAIPWTRLSIEGAEIRESVGKRYAR